MNYYKVPKQMDNKRTANGTIFVAGELLTEKQALKMGANLDALERIELSQRKTYWFFGARFAMLGQQGTFPLNRRLMNG